MTRRDGDRWDDRYTRRAPSRPDTVGPPTAFASFANEFPCSGSALDIACGQGQASVWLAKRGMRVEGVDVSAVAVADATALARTHDVAQRCRFTVADLDDGLPVGSPVDVVLCHMFRDPRLDAALVERLRPGGLLAVAALSEVGAEPGSYRVGPGELPRAFAGLEIVASGEGDGTAWLLARR